MSAKVGQLPQPGVDHEQSVCLVVELNVEKLKVGIGSGWANLSAVLSVVDAQVDESMDNIDVDLVNSRDSSDNTGAVWQTPPRRVRLVHRIFRQGRAARWAVSSEEASLRRKGHRFVVIGRVEPATGDKMKWAPDTWILKDGTEFLTLDEAAALGDTAIRVAYSRRGPVSSAQLAALTNKALKILKEAPHGQWQDPLPESVRRRYRLPSLLDALEGMHSPASPVHYERCRRRLAFQELFCLQLKLLLQRAAFRSINAGGEGVAGSGREIKGPSVAHTDEEVSAVLVKDSELYRHAVASLPFQLTNSQHRALSSILDQMSTWPAMMCLLQGDVGCGKTVVALLAAIASVGSGYQCAVMAPTSILAEQHFRGLSKLLDDMKQQGTESGNNNNDNKNNNNALPRIALLTGSTRRAERNEILAGLADGSIDIVVGTHALVSDPVIFSKLGLAIIDEQHKFGVEQRAKLLSKGFPPPHVVSMTATPIPRSLALVLHGELTLVTIDEIPPGRSPVATHVIIDGKDERSKLYEEIRSEITAGGGVYIVCPMVDGTTGSSMASHGSCDFDEEEIVLSDTDDEFDPGNDEDTTYKRRRRKKSTVSSASSELKAAVLERERLVQEGELEASQCAVLHGRMSPEEKEATLAAFAAGAVPVLISTTVVEVGVDVPAASMMVVEHAERFGLAQLHQLRGRVGRGERASTCYLMTDRSGDELARLRVMERSSSGFDVAEADFEIRGAGEILGKKQSGKESMGGMKVCELPRDGPLVEQAREAAAMYMVENGGTPRGWSRELLSCVVDPKMLDLDLHELPKQH